MVIAIMDTTFPQDISRWALPCHDPNVGLEEKALSSHDYE
jgi:hypothetical protein